MISFSTLSLIRMGVALIGGVYMARLLRNPVRAIVTRATPMQKRMSDDFFRRRARITMPVGIIIALSIAALFNWGLWEAGQALGLVTQPEIAAEERLIQEKWEPSPAIEEQEEQPPINFNLNPPAQTEAEERPSSYNIPLSAKQAPAYETPSSYYPAASPEGRYYLQINAFQKLENARAQQKKWPDSMPYACHLTRLEGDYAPYKVLVGPFATYEEAKAFRQKQQLRGFVREFDELGL